MGTSIKMNLKPSSGSISSPNAAYISIMPSVITSSGTFTTLYKPSRIFNVLLHPGEAPATSNCSGATAGAAPTGAVGRKRCSPEDEFNHDFIRPICSAGSVLLLFSVSFNT